MCTTPCYSAERFYFWLELCRCSFQVSRKVKAGTRGNVAHSLKCERNVERALCCSAPVRPTCNHLSLRRSARPDARTPDPSSKIAEGSGVVDDCPPPRIVNDSEGIVPTE